MGSAAAEARPYRVRPYTQGGCCALSPSEQVVVWALRQRLTDAGVMPSVHLRHGLAFVLPHRFVAFVAAAHDLLIAVVALLDAHARRDIGLLRCACVSRDEHMLLRLFAAAQHGTTAEADALARELVQVLAVDTLLRAVGGVGLILAHAGLHLPLHSRAGGFALH